MNSVTCTHCNHAYDKDLNPSPIRLLPTVGVKFLPGTEGPRGGS